MQPTDSRPSSQLIKGLAYLPGVIGAVRTGVKVDRQVRGREMSLPAKLDEFIITQRHRDANGNWVYDERDALLRSEHGTVELSDPADATESEANRKLRRIPIRIAYDNPDLSINEQYAAFSQQGRPVCVGNGVKARRADVDASGLVKSVEEVPCPGPEQCVFGRTARCDAFMRFVFHIEGQCEDDGLYILRTGSYNAVSEVRAKLEELHQVFGGKLAGLPMWLTLETKQSAMSHQSVFWYASIKGRYDSRIQAAKEMNARRQEEVDVGLNRAASEARLLELRGNGHFVESGPDDAEQFDDLWSARWTQPDGTTRTASVRSRGVQHVAPDSASAQVVGLLMSGSNPLNALSEALETREERV